MCFMYAFIEVRNDQRLVTFFFSFFFLESKIRSQIYQILHYSSSFIILYAE